MNEPGHTREDGEAGPTDPAPLESDAFAPSTEVDAVGAGPARAPERSEERADSGRSPTEARAEQAPRTVIPGLGTDRIGSCRIVEEIGSGGMAVIYRAVQESLHRTVAVKALKSSVAVEKQYVARFEREALSLAALQHENIIQVHDFHEIHGARFIVMEFVEGIDLYDLLEKRPALPVDVAAIVALQVARALDYAHYRGVIHRDVKPANIMVGKSGVVKLMDFGIARDSALTAAGGDLTADGTGLGTPSYMSPEQILGDRLDPRSDVFSLGVVLFQMACGRKPFVEDERRSVMHKIRLERHPSARRLRPAVPRELERIIDRCLRKRRGDRYATTQDLVVALERFVARRCEMNYHARVVTELCDLGVVSGEEAERWLRPAAAATGGGGYSRPLTREGLTRPRLRRLVMGQAGVLAAMAVATAFLQVAPIGAAHVSPAAIVPAPARPPGYLRMVVDPWAEVWIDGQLVETTPLARPLSVPEGKHVVELRNPYFQSERREILVRRGASETVRVALRRR